MLENSTHVMLTVYERTKAEERKHFGCGFEGISKSRLCVMQEDG